MEQGQIDLPKLAQKLEAIHELLTDLAFDVYGGDKGARMIKDICRFSLPEIFPGIPLPTSAAPAPSIVELLGRRTPGRGAE